MSALFSHPDTHEPHTPATPPSASRALSYTDLFQEPAEVNEPPAQVRRTPDAL